ncbi:TPA: DUF551 domain-containing protein [Enterobacter hormaechei]
MDNELFAIALASLEAKPIGAFHIADQQVDGTTDYIKDGEWPIDDGVIEVYAAPPAPVSVPDDVTAEDCPAFIKYDLTQVDEAWARGFNTCRAAMLQGAEPVTTAYKLPFEQWLSQQTGTIDVECGCVMTEVFFHWLRVAYEAGDSPVIPDGWVACSERNPEEAGRYWCYIEEQNDLGKSHYQWNCSWNGDRWWVESENGGRVTHWMPLPAAPQQEA